MITKRDFILRGSYFCEQYHDSLKRAKNVYCAKCAMLHVMIVCCKNVSINKCVYYMNWISNENHCTVVILSSGFTHCRGYL